MKRLITLTVFIVLSTGMALTQDFMFNNPELQNYKPGLKSQGIATNFSTHQSLKKSGHYTTEDWRALMDSVWGPGAPTETKLAVFDTFWNTVDQAWGGFPNLDINWDSLRNVYRPIVEAGMSRGRFAGILSRLTCALQEFHSGMADMGIDSTFGLYWDFLTYAEYPNQSSYHYSPGIPIINLNVTVFRTNFGAGLTMLPDSSVLVYSVMPDHPLGLQPGDIILGYDGIPWGQLINELLVAELPIVSNEQAGNYLCSSTAAAYHNKMMCAGMNWGLFDTIDIVKYLANDTLHYPTLLLATISQPYHIATEQLPVDGVSFPDIQGNKLLSWGIVEGTTIGYVYAWDWLGASGGATLQLFGQAIDELMHIYNVSGLILDFRTNYGGMNEYANYGFKHLFNIDPSDNFSEAIRVIGEDHYAFTIGPANPIMGAPFIPTQELFDHPIAVLTGPNCWSSGDYNAFRLRFHPMVRFFGKPTNGAYIGGTKQGNLYEYPYMGQIRGGCAYSNVNDEGYLIHNPFPVDEEVWLTRDGVANGEDDVVKRALEWISNISYAHSVTLNKTLFEPYIDTLVIVSARVENPNEHQLSVQAVFTNESDEVLDSMYLYDDGSHLDGEAGDSIWANSWTFKAEQTVRVSVSTEDTAANDKRTLTNVVQFTSVGPLIFDEYMITSDDQVIDPGDRLQFKIKIRNTGPTTTATNVTCHVIALDTCASANSTIFYNFGNIASETSVEAAQSLVITFNSYCGGYSTRFALDIMSNNYSFWSDTFEIEILPPTTVIEYRENEFGLTQNYPNPVNTTTTISYQLPEQSHVLLRLYDIQGREVTTLVNRVEELGYKSVILNTEGWLSGIYYYCLQAGDFVQTKKLILLR